MFLRSEDVHVFFYVFFPTFSEQVMVLVVSDLVLLPNLRLN